MNKSKQLRYDKFGQVPEGSQGDTQGLDDVNRGISRERHATTELQKDVALKLEQVDQRSKGFFGSLLMREGDRELLKKLDNARQEATDIVLSNRTDSLRMISESMRTYTKSLANTLIITLETGNSVALEGHYMQAKLNLTEQVEDLNKKFLNILEEKQMELEKASDFVKPMVKDQGLTLMSNWMDDYENIIKEFSEIRQRRFK